MTIITRIVAQHISSFTYWLHLSPFLFLLITDIMSFHASIKFQVCWSQDFVEAVLFGISWSQFLSKLCCEVPCLLPQWECPCAFKDPVLYGIMLTCSPCLSSFICLSYVSYHSRTSLKFWSFISPTDIIGVLRDFEVPHACDSGTSSILFGWHKSAGHSSLVHSGLGSHRVDSGAERAAASHWTLMFCPPRVLVLTV